MKNIVTLLAFVLSFTSFAQITNYHLSLQPETIAELPGMQSYSVAQHDGEWLIVGGRIDGLHKRQPFAAFDVPGKNINIYVINPAEKKVYSSNLASLSPSLSEQLGATNHNFIQHGNHLIITGGYGYSATALDHKTFNSLISINVSETISAIKEGKSFTSQISQISDSLFAVTGGRLELLGNTFYLIGGHNFNGRYNPQGPDHGPGFSQYYTNQIRKFDVSYSPLGFTLQSLETDTNLHRRDYNVVPQIFPNQIEGVTAFSGVFQPTADLPYLNSVDIKANSHAVNNTFTQYYNHYHCATLPIYDKDNDEMHTFFFGGISQYFDSSGILTKDDNVPFVKTIARVTRNSSGQMHETKLAEEMPALLGAGAEFILNPELDLYDNGVVKFENMNQDSIYLGYIFGGIESTAPNVFFSNATNASTATNKLLKVYLVKNQTGTAHALEKRSSSLQFQIYPNPINDEINTQFYLKDNSNVTFKITDARGRLIDHFHYANLPAMWHNKVLNLPKKLSKGVYYISLKTDFEEITIQVVNN